MHAAWPVAQEEVVEVEVAPEAEAQVEEPEVEAEAEAEAEPEEYREEEGTWNRKKTLQFFPQHSNKAPRRFQSEEETPYGCLRGGAGRRGNASVECPQSSRR